VLRSSQLFRILQVSKGPHLVCFLVVHCQRKFMVQDWQDTESNIGLPSLPGIKIITLRFALNAATSLFESSHGTAAIPSRMVST
jgi:hypothetical protein